MGSKVSMPAAPAAPAPIDPAQSSIDYINAMADPDLQARIFQAEQLYRPQYTNLELADINTLMQGGDGYKGLLDLTDEATQRANTLASQQLSQQRAADIADVEALGGRASEAFRTANPQLMQAMAQADALRGGGMTVAPQIQGLIGQNIPGVSQSQLAQGLQTAGMGQLTAGAGEGAINQKGLDYINRGGNLTATQLRNVVQQTRAGSQARGRLEDNSALAGEMGARLAEEMNIEALNTSLGAQLLGQSFGMGQQRLGTAQGIYGQDLAREQGNLQAALSQRTTNLQSLLGLGQLEQAQQQANRAYALNMVGLNQATASDPFQAILGRPSQSQAAGMGQTQFAAGLAGQPLGPNLFDPNAGINLGLQNNANAANYAANIYGSQASYAGATNQGRGAMIGGIFSGLGALGAGAIIGCWVAREVYGEDNPCWLVFRKWLFNEAPAWFRALYLKHGEKFAVWVANKPMLKAVIRSMMNLVVNPRLKLEVA